MLDNSTISNRRVEGFIKVVSVSVISIGKPLASSMLTVTNYGPIRSVSTCVHVSTSTHLAGSLHICVCQFVFNFRHVFQFFTCCSVCVTNLGQL